MEEVTGRAERSDLVVRSVNCVLGFWDICINGALVSDAADGGSPGSRARHGNRVKNDEHSKYVDEKKNLKGFSLDTCGGIDVEASKAIEL